MSERVTAGLDRRCVLRSTALVLASAGVLDRLGASAALALVQEERGASDGYERRFFNEHEWTTMVRLTDMILPRDDVSVGAADVGCAEFIDLMCSEAESLQDIFASGLLWLDHRTRRLHGDDFIDLDERDQAAMLDLLAQYGNDDAERGYEGHDESVEYQAFSDYGTTAPSDLAPGARFFGWVRRMTVDAFYTTPEGVEDVGYIGNRFLSRWSVPEESLNYALSRAPAKRARR